MMSGDNTSSTGVGCDDFVLPTSVNGSTSAKRSVESIRSEILCFICDKQRCVPFDNLVKICVDFYREDEIMVARNLLESASGARLPKRKGGDRLRSTVEDIVKVMLNPSYDLPEFYAIELARLPPVDMTHCDVSAILFELQGLRNEVRELKSLKEEVCSLTPRLKDLQKVCNEVDQLKQSVAELQSKLQCRQSADDSSEIKTSFPHIRHETDASVKLFSSIVGELRSTGISERLAKKPVAPVVGKAVNNHRIKTVLTKRSVDIFISRLSPSTTSEDLQACIADILPDTASEDVICTKLDSKYEQLYSSYYICVRVDAMMMKYAIDKLMDAESWPSGLLVKRYFKPKPKNDEQY
jgi:hypothetical protein